MGLRLAALFRLHRIVGAPPPLLSSAHSPASASEGRGPRPVSADPLSRRSGSCSATSTAIPAASVCARAGLDFAAPHLPLLPPPQQRWMVNLPAAPAGASARSTPPRAEAAAAQSVRPDRPEPHASAGSWAALGRGGHGVPAMRSFSSASPAGEELKTRVHDASTHWDHEHAGRPDLAEPAHVSVATAMEVATLLPASHWICGLRGRSFEERGLVVRYQEGTMDGECAAADGPDARAPSASWTEMTYPFASSAVLRDTYRLVGPGEADDGRMRVGLLLEDLDCFTADVAGRHIKRPGVAHVTAAGEQVTWFRPPPAATPSEGAATVLRDLRAVGQVTWVGRSSLEVCVDLRTRESESAPWVAAGCGRFMIVGRDIESQKSIQVPALVPATHAELEKHRQGVQRQAHRTASRGGGGDAANKASVPHSQMPGGEFTSLKRMYWQDRNTQGRIFGGHLINGAYELAEAVSELQPGVPRGFRAMSGFKFVAAPSIPGIVRYTARLANGHGASAIRDELVVLVKAEEQSADGLLRLLTSEARFTFD